MSDKNIISINKDSTANNSQDNGKQNNPSSPKGSYSTNFQSFTSTEINQMIKIRVMEPNHLY